MAIKILIVDDHQVFSSSLKIVLESNDYIVENVSSVENALKYLKAVHFDIILTDIEMPCIDGVEFIKTIKKQKNILKHLPKIIVLTSNKKESLFKKLYALDIDGFLSKNITQFELLKALDNVSKDQKYFDNTLYNDFLKSNTKEKQIDFTLRELEVLRLILDEKTTSEIAAELVISPYTVEGHRKNLMQKTNSKNVVGLIKFSLNNHLF